MECCVFTGIPHGCDNSIGGIRRAWAACYDKISKPTIDEETNMITALPDATKENIWHAFSFRKQTGSVTQTITRDDATGSLYYSSDIVLQFVRQETSKRLDIISIAESDTSWIIEDNNKKYWYFGLYYPVTLTDGSVETGTAFDDLNGYTITLNAMEKVLAYEIDEKAMGKLLEK